MAPTASALRYLRYPLGTALGSLAQLGVSLAQDTAVSAPVALAQLAIVLMPGPAASLIIELLGAWAMRLSIAAAVLATLGLAVVAAWRRSPALALAPWTIGPLTAIVVPQLSADLPLTLASAALGATVAAAVILPRGASHGDAPAPSRRSSARISAVPRRRALAVVGALAAVTLLAGAGIRASRRALARVSAAGPLPPTEARPAAPPEPPDDPPLVMRAQIDPDVTGNEDFYVVDEAIIDPAVDVERWRLRVHGHVRVPYELTFDDLLAHAGVEQQHTLECISNEVGGPLIGNALWRGVPVRRLLERAGVLDGAIKVSFRSVEGYSSAIPLDLALDERTLIAYGMNGVALPREHGFPARLLIPGLYGMKNVKWLGAVEVTTTDHLGTWERKGWSDEAIVQTMSRIDRPRSHDLLRPGVPVVVAGIAYAGARGVVRVEVSTDDRRTWQPAELGRRLSPITWRRWAYRWTPPAAGWYRIAARAWDERGPQTPDEREPLPFGATGIHSYQVEAR